MPQKHEQAPEQEPSSSQEHSSRQERKVRERALDETIEDSFPASDPPSSIPNPDDESVLERDRSKRDERSGGSAGPDALNRPDESRHRDRG
jgi:hypothetical protein